MAATKYPHIRNEDVEKLLAQNMTKADVARLYGVGVSTIRRRAETIERQKWSGEWYANQGLAKPEPKRKAEPAYTPIWDLPKMNSKVRSYRMSRKEIAERYGRPGLYKDLNAVNSYVERGGAM
jgi:hypothetical protein